MEVCYLIDVKVERICWNWSGTRGDWRRTKGDRRRAWGGLGGPAWRQVRGIDEAAIVMTVARTYLSALIQHIDDVALLKGKQTLSMLSWSFNECTTW